MTLYNVSYYGDEDYTTFDLQVYANSWTEAIDIVFNNCDKYGVDPESIYNCEYACILTSSGSYALKDGVLVDTKTLPSFSMADVSSYLG